MVLQDEGERRVGQEGEGQGVLEEEVESEGEREVDVAQTFSSLFSSLSFFIFFS
jgi:flagellar biogenesis protein FliO